MTKYKIQVITTITSEVIEIDAETINEAQEMIDSWDMIPDTETEETDVLIMEDDGENETKH